MGCNSIFSLIFSILIFAVLVNFLGLYLLRKDSSRQTNQNLILKFLSTLQLCHSCILIARWSLICHGLISSHIVVQILVCIIYCIYLNVTMVMVTMTFDRLIATKYPLKYAFILTKKKVQIILFSSAFALITIFGISVSILTYAPFIYILDKFVNPIVSVVATIFLVLAYIYIFVQISRRRTLGNSMQIARISRTTENSVHNFRIKRATENPMQNIQIRAENQKYLKMASIIALTYFTCYVVPDVSLMVCRKFVMENADIYRILWYLGLVFDPITYIFMQERLRKKLVDMVVCCRKQGDSRASRRQQRISTICENQAAVLDTTV